MGVGKSTLGKKLARRLNVDFIDADQYIEEQVGMSILDYFTQFGEEKFRVLERDFIRQLDISARVVATGGGLPCFYDNMDTMNATGVTIYLHRPPKELVQRLKNAKTERPLIAGLSDEELLDFISAQLEEREQFYNQAQFVLTRGHHTVEDLCGLVFEK